MKTIVWDIDDVLNDLMRVWLEQFWLAKPSRARIRYSEIKENPPHRLLQASKEEYLSSLDDFRLSGRYEQLKPNREIAEWFAAHGFRYRHVALTRVPVAVSHISSAWVLKNFGSWIRSFHFIPSYRAGENPPFYDEDKGAYLNYFGKADLLIDDTLENIEAAQRAGVKTLVFPRPWNNSKLTIPQLLEEVSKIAND